MNILNDLKSKYLELYSDETKEFWERYSVSLGFAQYEVTDLGIADIMKRADEEMYKDKASFKQSYGSYR